MDEGKKYWNQFAESGRIDDYMRYRSAVERGPQLWNTAENTTRSVPQDTAGNAAPDAAEVTPHAADPRRSDRQGKKYRRV